MSTGALTKLPSGQGKYYDGSDLPNTIDAQWEALSDEIDRLSERRYDFSAEDMRRAGVFVTLGHDGQARIEQGFVVSRTRRCPNRSP